jgi:hypothetical protein
LLYLISASVFLLFSQIICSHGGDIVAPRPDSSSSSSSGTFPPASFIVAASLDSVEAQCGDAAGGGAVVNDDWVQFSVETKQMRTEEGFFLRLATEKRESKEVASAIAAVTNDFSHSAAAAAAAAAAAVSASIDATPTVTASASASHSGCKRKATAAVTTAAPVETPAESDCQKCQKT